MAKTPDYYPPDWEDKKRIIDEYDKYRTDTAGLRGCLIILFTILMIILLIMSCPTTCKGQSWSYTNKGLYPNSIGVTFNAKNQAIGIRYGYLFQNPILNSLPLGVYCSYSHTINPNLFINNYRWEEKYAIGMSITLPDVDLSSEAHTFGTIGLVYNRHPREWQNEDLLPGQYNSDVAVTIPIGLDIGAFVQAKHCLVHLKFDVMNWMQYVEFGACYTFSFYKSQ